MDVSASPENALLWVGDPRRLTELTPAWFGLTLDRSESGTPDTSAPGSLTAGDRIRYRLDLGPVPLRWESVIDHWDPPHRFSYYQGRGPFRWFWHDHLLEPVPGGTRITDVVEFAVPGGPFAHRALVLPMLRRIFAVRRARLQERLGVPGRAH